MPRISAEENELVELLERLPFDEATRTAWAESIRTSGLNEDTIKEIQAKVTELPEPDENQNVNRRKSIVMVNNLIRRWRLNRNLRSVRR